MFEVCDADGRLVAVHHRVDKPDGEKIVYWRGPNGEKKLEDIGLKLEDLPLYGAEMVSDLGDDEALVLVEGEKVQEALEAAGIPTVGTVCGASVTPNAESLEVLRGREVVIWADGDEAGRQHMERVAERLQGVDAVVRWYEWDDPPEGIKGPDAADHPAIISKKRKAVDRLLDDLLGAPKWEPKLPEGLQGRMLLGQMLQGGIEPTPMLVDGLLYEGRIHSIASPPGTGKTLLALWLCHDIVKRGGRVIYLDAENGPKLMAERLGDLGADPEMLDEQFHYYNGADVDLGAENLEALTATVDQVRPSLVVFDSFADFLAVAGLEENSNSDCTLWMTKLAQPLKDAGISVLILDHVPKANNKGPRGASSKVAKVDVQWNLEDTIGFDRERTGLITLKPQKDREAWMPRGVQFSIGGGVFARSSGTIEEPDEVDGLTNSQRTALEALRPHPEGLTFGEWKDACVPGEMGDGTFNKARKVLADGEWVYSERRRWFVADDPDDPEKGAHDEVHLWDGDAPEKGAHDEVHLSDDKHVNMLQNGGAPGENAPKVHRDAPRQNGGAPSRKTPKGVAKCTYVDAPDPDELLRREGWKPDPKFGDRMWANPSTGETSHYDRLVEERMRDLEADPDLGDHPRDCLCERCLP